MSVRARLALVLLISILGFPFAGPAVAAPAPAPAGAAVSDRLIVGLRPGLGSDGGELPVPHLATTRIFPAAAHRIHPMGGATYRLDLPPATDLTAMMAALSRDPRVAYVEPDYLLQVAATDLAALAAVTPNDPAWPAQEEMRRIEAQRAWEVTTGRPEVVVAVLDTGASATHADLAGRVLPGFNFVTGKAGGADDQGHGTFTAALIAAAGNNRVGLAGLCWTCRILPLKILDKEGKGPSSAFSEAIRYATDNGVRIVNVSAGGPNRSRSMEEAINYAVGKNVLVIASAGNNPDDQPNYPAAYEKVLAVAASGLNDQITGFSTFGAFVDLAAPGINITSAALESKNGVTRASGTSFSAPLVSGAAALLASLRQDLPAGALTNLLLDTAVDIGPPGRDDNFGAGRVAAYDAMLAMARPEPNGGAALQVATNGDRGGFALSARGFAPNERLRAWLTAANGRVVVKRGLAADDKGNVSADLSFTNPENAGDNQLTIVGDQSGRVAVAHLALAIPGRTYFQPVGDPGAADRSYFPETQHTLSGGFRAYWEANGGLPIFGFPISEEFSEVNRSDGKTYVVQYFERNRFEYHPEHAGTPHEIQLGLLGNLLNEERIFPPVAPVPETPNRRYFAATRHTLSGDFLRYWEANGGLAIFGYPTSEQFTENGRTVQYFERNRFELFPNNEPAYRVQLGLLGTDLAQRNGYIP
jgi:subtilisin family serine protease